MKRLWQGVLLVLAMVLMALPVAAFGALAWLIAEAQKSWAVEAKIGATAIGVAIGAAISAVLASVFASSLGQWWRDGKKSGQAPDKGPIQSARDRGDFERDPQP